MIEMHPGWRAVFDRVPQQPEPETDETDQPERQEDSAR